MKEWVLDNKVVLRDTGELQRYDIDLRWLPDKLGNSVGHLDIICRRLVG